MVKQTKGGGYKMIENRGKNVWRITVYTGKINGVYQRVTETFHGLKSEGLLRESQLKAQVKAGGIIANKKITFEEFVEQWEKNYAKNLAPKTLFEYKKFLKKINAFIGNIPLCELKPLHLTDFYNKLRQTYKQDLNCTNQKLSENTVLHYYTLIGGILKKAVEWEFIDRNPNEKVPRPKIKKHEPNFYDVEQVQELIKCLENESLKTQAIIFLALDTGARRGELTGLDWENVDLTKGTVHIVKSTQKLAGQLIEKAPKNNSSIRLVPITQKTIEVLKAYKKEQCEKELKVGNKWEKTTKVFTTDLGGYMHPDTPSKIFSKFLKKYNLPKITFHELRHTSVSLLINAGIQAQTISKRVGHSTISTTQNIYSHLFEKSANEAVNVMSNILENKAQ